MGCKTGLDDDKEQRGRGRNESYEIDVQKSRLTMNGQQGNAENSQNQLG